MFSDEPASEIELERNRDMNIYPGAEYLKEENPTLIPMQEKDLEGTSDDIRGPLLEKSVQEKWGYIRKVYGIVSVQLLFTFTLVILCIRFQSLNNFFGSIFILVLSIICTPLGLIGALLSKNIVPYNYIFTFTFTLGCTGIVCFITRVIDPTIVFTAVLLTLLTTLLITFISFTSTDGVSLVCFIMVLLVAYLLELIATFFFFTDIWLPLYMCSGVFLYAAYLLIDTKLLVERGDFDDYIVASVIIYWDIIYLFLYILLALASRKN